MVTQLPLHDTILSLIGILSINHSNVAKARIMTHFPCNSGYYSGYHATIEYDSDPTIREVPKLLTHQQLSLIKKRTISFPRQYVVS